MRGSEVSLFLSFHTSCNLALALASYQVSYSNMSENIITILYLFYCTNVLIFTYKMVHTLLVAMIRAYRYRTYLYVRNTGKHRSVHTYHILLGASFAYARIRVQPLKRGRWLLDYSSTCSQQARATRSCRSNAVFRTTSSTYKRTAVVLLAAEYDRIVRTLPAKS